MRIWIGKFERLLGRLRLYGWAGSIIFGAIPTAGIAVIWAWLSRLPGVFVALAGLGAAGFAFFIINQVFQAQKLGWLPKSWRKPAQSDAAYIYVGRISVGTNDLAEDQRIELGIRSFNGLGQPLTVTSIRK